jgi:hypothetical protein
MPGAPWQCWQIKILRPQRTEIGILELVEKPSGLNHE